MNERPVEDSDLARLQRWVVEHLQGRRALPQSEAVSREARDRLTGNDRLSPVEQLEIYREQFWLRHTASLVEDFPGVGGILGQTEWEKLVEGYLGASSPRGWTLRELGRHFPEHVASQHGLPHHALCSDMARLEWCFIELFDAADRPGLDFGKLGSLPPGSLETGQIVLNPALALLEVSHPVADLRQRLLAARTTHDAPPVAIPEPEAQQLVLYRAADRRLYHRPVGPEAFALLAALQRGLSLVAACEHALEQAPEHAERLQRNVGTWFQQWAKRGWIVDVVPNPTPD
ncbi:MAG TPA: DNA-binding domain-containing protein [Polyangiaceae bacterium]|nr:DNA-binding domain-containing protein [Polyangiaceae bacterium]